MIGSGSSGIDLVALLSQVANYVVWSRRATAIDFPFKNVMYKGEVKRFTKTGVEFVDGTEETLTVIFYATGYNFDYPFLSNDSGITVENNIVQPLYKHIFNIKHPTMLFIGIASGLLPTFPTVELQVNFLHIFFSIRFIDKLPSFNQTRFALKYLSGDKTLPSKDEMLSDMQQHIEIHMNRHNSSRSSQFFALEHRDYFTELSNLTDVESPPEVISSIYLDNDAMRKGDPTTFRKYRYIIVDDIRYVKKKYEN